MAIVVRERSPCDTKLIKTCMVELQKHQNELDGRFHVNDEALEQLWVRIIDDCERFNGVIFVAEEKGQLVGFLCVLLGLSQEDPDEINYKYAQISDFSVLEGNRAQGVGLALLSHTNNYVREAGLSLVRINVLAANVGANSFYQRYGFKEREIILELPLNV